LWERLYTLLIKISSTSNMRWKITLR
jgi:hypothetical protein